MSVLPIPDDAGNLHPRVVELFDRPQYAQRTPEWYDVRKNLVTASDASNILKIKPFAGFKGCPREELMNKKLNDHSIQGMCLAHGVRYETEAANLAMSVLGEKMFEFGLVKHDSYDWLAASPDGVTANGYAVEIKCPMRRKIIPGEIPHHYYPQVQIQMEVLNLDFCYFIQYKPAILSETGSPFVDIVVIERDVRWFETHKPALEQFLVELNALRTSHVKIEQVFVKCDVDDNLYDDTKSYVRVFDDNCSNDTTNKITCEINELLYKNKYNV
jgi:putative phage-type endonuclease